jgi:hypothetical protein
MAIEIAIHSIAVSPHSAGTARPLIAPGGAYPPGSAAGSAPRLKPAKAPKSTSILAVTIWDRLCPNTKQTFQVFYAFFTPGTMAFVPVVPKSINPFPDNKKAWDNSCPNAHAGIHTRQGSAVLGQDKV